MELAKFSADYIEHLIGYGIIVRRGDDFEFAFDVVASAVMANFSGTSDVSLESKRREISRRRNIIEEEIRSFLYRSHADEPVTKCGSKDFSLYKRNSEGGTWCFRPP